MSDHPLVDALKNDPDRPAQHGGRTLEAEGAEVGPIGIRARALRLRRDRPARRGADEIARRVSERAGYLLEPLDLVEATRDQAILRSPPPQDGGDYYEMRLTPREMALERFRGQRGQSREPRPLDLTWEQTERLVRDVEAAQADE